MKRVCALVLAAVMMLTITSCGRAQPETEILKEPSVTAEQDVPETTAGNSVELALPEDANAAPEVAPGEELPAASVEMSREPTVPYAEAPEETLDKVSADAMEKTMVQPTAEFEIPDSGHTEESDPLPLVSEPLPRHAPNMYVDWDLGDKNYDVLSVDWYCDIDSENTYWAVHNWAGGYAGFQNLNGKHVLLMSLWDLEDGTTPTVEFALDGKNGAFGGEGTGKQVFTNYSWKTGVWYTMRVQIYADATTGKTYFEQWVKEEGGDWLKTAVISYPSGEHIIDIDSVFMEDFVFNNLQRACRLRNAYGRTTDDQQWVSWTDWSVSNTYFPTDPPTWDNVEWNISFDCDWSQDGKSLWLSSGGGNFIPSEKTLPITYQLPVVQEDAFWLK